MRYFVFGLGKSGRACIEVLKTLGYIVFGIEEAVDNSDELRTWLEKNDIQPISSNVVKFSHDDILVLSPGVSLEHPLVEQAKQKRCNVIGEIELSFQLFPHKLKNLVAITGTNGKTTTTLLTTHILNFAGMKAQAVGNIGVPLIRVLFERVILDDILVIEISSYQLETTTTKGFDASVFINISPDHLDRHKSMDAYIKAKYKIASCTFPEGTFFLNTTVMEQKLPSWLECAMVLFGQYEKALCSWDQKEYFFYKKRGMFKNKLLESFSHDKENFFAAALLAHSKGVSIDQAIEAYEHFKKAPHTLEYVRTLNGVTYYDDSKGTNIDAVVQAVTAFSSPVILIAGGVHKGESYRIWQKAFQNRVKKIILIGAAASLIYQELHTSFDCTHAHSLEEAVHIAYSIAQQDDTVLLSPGCSSFDMFKDYKHRGAVFQNIVQSLS